MFCPRCALSAPPYLLCCAVTVYHVYFYFLLIRLLPASNRLLMLYTTDAIGNEWGGGGGGGEGGIWKSLGEPLSHFPCPVNTTVVVVVVAGMGWNSFMDIQNFAWSIFLFFFPPEKLHASVLRTFLYYSEHSEYVRRCAMNEYRSSQKG